MERDFVHFYCPVLFRDDPVELARAHIVNSAFANSSRRWVIQRKDVDNFYGSHFEADFVLLAHKGKHSSFDVLTDTRLSRKLRPKLLVDGVHVPHYVPHGTVPHAHSELVVSTDTHPEVRLVLKLEPSEALSALGKSWQIAIEKDIRLPALVALLKACHLTLFSLVGYRYALSGAGIFMGWEVLGKFFVAQGASSRLSVLSNARLHFSEFVNLVRPMVTPPSGMGGTISDGLLYLCPGTPKPWALMVFIRADDQFHAVMVPIMEDDEGAARFARFLKAPSARLEVRLARYVEDRWEVAKESSWVDWPAARFEESLTG